MKFVHVETFFSIPRGRWANLEWGVIDWLFTSRPVSPTVRRSAIPVSTNCEEHRSLTCGVTTISTNSRDHLELMAELTAEAVASLCRHLGGGAEETVLGTCVGMADIEGNRVRLNRLVAYEIAVRPHLMLRNPMRWAALTPGRRPSKCPACGV